MNLKNNILLVVMACLLSFSGLAMAGKQGISFYGGLGLLAVQPNKVNTTEYDLGAGGGVFIGIEEDGWALEYHGFATLDAATNSPNTEYAVEGGAASLGYRTLETRSGIYFLLSVGKVDGDVTTSTTGLPDTLRTYSGNIGTIGLGMRMDKTERMELDYSLIRLTSDGVAGSFNTHMLSLRYIWGGNVYDPRF